MKEEKKESVDLTSHIDFKFADYDMLIEVYRDVMVFALCKEYKTLRKYNLQQLCEHSQKDDVSQKEQTLSAAPMDPVIAEESSSDN